MRKSFAVALAIASAAAGVLLSHRMETVQADVKPGTGFAAIPGTEGRPGYVRRLRNREGLAEGHQHASRQSRSGPTAPARASTPRIPTASSCSSAASCPTSSARKRSCCPSLARAFSSPSAACPGATRPFPHCPARGGTRSGPRRRTQAVEGHRRRGRQVGDTASSSSTPTATSSRRWTQWDKILQAPALRHHQPLRSGKARVDRRRSHARHL